MLLKKVGSFFFPQSRYLSDDDSVSGFCLSFFSSQAATWIAEKWEQQPKEKKQGCKVSVWLYLMQTRAKIYRTIWFWFGFRVFFFLKSYDFDIRRLKKSLQTFLNPKASEFNPIETEKNWLKLKPSDFSYTIFLRSDTSWNFASLVINWRKKRCIFTWEPKSIAKKKKRETLRLLYQTNLLAI